MKRLLLVLLCLLLVGCNSSIADIDDAFSIEQDKVNTRVNNNTTYYNYYLPSDVDEQNYENGAVLINFGNSSAIMNLNVASIVSDKYYASYEISDDGFFSDDKLVYTRNSTYLDINDNQIRYFCRVYKYDNELLIHFMSKTVNFYGYSNDVEVKDLCQKLLQMAKNVKVNYDVVMDDYSSNDVIDYQKNQINLFDLVLPVNGKLEELLLD